MKTYTHQEWIDEAVKRFGKDPKQWKFVCPSCNTVQTINDFLEAGIDHNDIEPYIAFSCIGRFTDTKGCNWTLGGLLKIHKVEVIMKDLNRPTFAFAE